MTSALACPLCSSATSPASLEAHLRACLSYTPLRCLLCPLSFHALPQALAHFGGPLGAHPGHAVALTEQRDEAKERALAEALAQAGALPPRPCAQCACCRLWQGGPAEELRVPLPKAELKALALLAQPRPQPEEAELGAPPVADESLADETMAEPPRKLVKLEPGLAAPPETKATLAAVKMEAQGPSDGKAACLQCGVRVRKLDWKRHALTSHSEAAPFLCNACPYKAKRMEHMRRHLKAQHAMEEAAEGSFSRLSLAKETARALELCFGDVQCEDAKAECRECEVEVKLSARLAHVAFAHLRQAVHRCRLCDFASTSLSPKDLRRHLAADHGQKDLTEDNSTSDADKYAPVLKRMMEQLF